MDREGARNKNMSKRVKKVHSYKRNDHLPVFTQKRKYFQAHDPKRKELGLEYFLFVLSHLTVFNFLAPVFDRAFFSYSYEYRARSGGGYCCCRIHAFIFWPLYLFSALYLFRIFVQVYFFSVLVPFFWRTVLLYFAKHRELVVFPGQERYELLFFFGILHGPLHTVITYSTFAFESQNSSARTN